MLSLFKGDAFHDRMTVVGGSGFAMPTVGYTIEFCHTPTRGGNIIKWLSNVRVIATPITPSTSGTGQLTAVGLVEQYTTLEITMLREEMISEELCSPKGGYLFPSTITGPYDIIGGVSAGLSGFAHCTTRAHPGNKPLVLS
jgi:hypothetical protein